MEQSGKWPQQACTTMFFLILKNVTSERPIALMPTLIRWWEAMRAPGVAKWQQKYRVEWDATDGRNGGAQRTVWEVLMEMKRFDGRTKAEDQGAVALVLNLAKAFERVLGLGDVLQFPKKDLAGILWVFRALEACTVRRVCGRAAHDHHVYLARVQVELLTFTHCFAGCVERSHKNLSFFEAEGFCR